MQRLLALCLTTTLLATTPLATASAYAHSGTLHARYAFVAYASGQLFGFDADQGDLIEITLTWADAKKDLDLRLLAPSPVCDINPDPDALCLAGTLASSPDCIGSRPITGPHGSESIVVTASETSGYGVAVIATAAPGSTAYTLTISVAGAAPAVDGPTDAVFLNRNPACKVP